MLGGGYATLPATVAVLEAQNNGTGPPFGDPGLVRSIYNGGNTLSRILAMVVGIAAMGSEYRHNTLASTYLATPRRFRVLLGKAATLLRVRAALRGDQRRRPACWWPSRSSA